MSSDRIFTLSNGVWTTPQGRQIVYSKETCQVFDDCFIQITKWPKNIILEVVVLRGKGGFKFDKPCVFEETYRVAKLSRHRFELYKGKLIQKAVEVAQSLYLD